MNKRYGFTLVEILIVVIVLAILAAAVVPQFSSAADTGRSSTAATVAKGLQRLASVKKIQDGSYPTTFTASMFEGGYLPTNPYFPTATTTFQVVNTASVLHPETKTSATSGAFWYNRANGIVRCMIADQGTAAANITLYNTVNACLITAIDQTD